MIDAPVLGRPAIPPPGRGGRRAWVVVCVALVAALVAGVAVAVYLHREHETRSGWQLKFDENFDGHSVRSSDWNVRNNTFLPYEKSILTSRPQNVQVAHGVLTLQALREQASVGTTRRDYTSAYLDTIGKKSWRYGRFEMRAQLPAGTTGSWPAFWLRADHGLGEIDILEGIGGLPTFTHQAVFQSTNGGQGKFENNHTLPSGTTAQWHVYAVDVEPDGLTFTIDGATVFRVTTAQAPWLSGTFDQPLNIRLNLQVGGTLPNYYHQPLTASSRFPARFVIDWIRVYQRR